MSRDDESVSSDTTDDQISEVEDVESIDLFGNRSNENESESDSDQSESSAPAKRFKL